MIVLVLLIIVTIMQYAVLVIDIVVNYDEPQLSFIKSKVELWLWLIPLLMLIFIFIKRVKIMINNLD